MYTLPDDDPTGTKTWKSFECFNVILFYITYYYIILNHLLPMHGINNTKLFHLFAFLSEERSTMPKDEVYFNMQKLEISRTKEKCNAAGRHSTVFCYQICPYIFIISLM